MLSRTIIDKEYIEEMREILYLGRDETRSEKNKRGHIFELMIDESIEDEAVKNEAIRKVNKAHKLHTEKENIVCGERYEVVDWIERLPECPYDFIIQEIQSKKYYLANLRNRTDGWPLFAIQEGKHVCSRLKMGSEWNCRMCIKYFNAVCQGR